MKFWELMSSLKGSSGIPNRVGKLHLKRIFGSIEEANRKRYAHNISLCATRGSFLKRWLAFMPVPP